jgi:hypothetical protein
MKKTCSCCVPVSQTDIPQHPIGCECCAPLRDDFNQCAIGSEMQDAPLIDYYREILSQPSNMTDLVKLGTSRDNLSMDARSELFEKIHLPCNPSTGYPSKDVLVDLLVNLVSEPTVTLQQLTTLVSFAAHDALLKPSVSSIDDSALTLVASPKTGRRQLTASGSMDTLYKTPEPRPLTRKSLGNMMDLNEARPIDADKRRRNAITPDDADAIPKTRKARPKSFFNMMKQLAVGGELSQRRNAMTPDQARDLQDFYNSQLSLDRLSLDEGFQSRSSLSEKSKVAPKASKTVPSYGQRVK